MPNSVLLLDVYPDKLNCRIRIPIKELKLAVSFGVDDVKKLTMRNEALVNYLNQHFRITDENNHESNKQLQTIFVETTEQNGTGKYAELVADFIIFPQGKDPRKFIVNYDAVIHQVNSHRALVSVRQDWETGRTGEENSEIGTIGFNIDTGKSNPLYVD